MGFHYFQKSLLSILVISLFIVHHAMLVSACAFKEDIFHVHVANNLPQNSAPLTVRCQSKDTDIGYHTLNVSQEIQWHFCTTWFSTLYFCHFWWNNREAVFDVYNLTYIKPKCHNHIPGQGKNTCYWIVRDDGFYLRDEFTFDRLNIWL